MIIIVIIFIHNPPVKIVTVIVSHCNDLTHLLHPLNFNLSTSSSNNSSTHTDGLTDCQTEAGDRSHVVAEGLWEGTAGGASGA